MTATPKNLSELNRLSQQLTWNQTKQENLFFPVLEEENFVQNIPTGKKTLYRNDRGKIEIISTVGIDYSVVENIDIHNAIQNFSNKLKLNLKLSSVYKNRRSNLVYDIKGKTGNDVNIDLNNEDGGHMIKLSVINSYDGTTKIIFELVVLRIRCLNGLSIPVGEIIKMTKKHVGINQEKFEKSIHHFLLKTLKKENFQKVIKKIENMQNETPSIKLSFLKSLPVNQMIPVLEGIKKYSTESVMCSYYNKEYDLTNSNDNKYVKNLILEKKEKSERAKKRIKTEERKSDYLEYNEKIYSLWTLLQFIVKVVSFKINQNRRFSVIQKLTNRFLQ